MSHQNLWMFRAHVLRWYDADTATRVRVDLGFQVSTTRSLRLARIDAPEIRGEERPEGLLALEAVQNVLPVGSEVIITTTKETGKYGRYIAEFYMPPEGEELPETGEIDLDSLVNVNDWLIEQGHAVAYED